MLSSTAKTGVTIAMLGMKLQNKRDTFIYVSSATLGPSEKPAHK